MHEELNHDFLSILSIFQNLSQFLHTPEIVFIFLYTAVVAGRFGVRLSSGAMKFSLPQKYPEWLWSPLSLYSMGTVGFSFPGIRRRAREADRSLSSGDGVKECVKL
jgi:hypothetical protein